MKYVVATTAALLAAPAHADTFGAFSDIVLFGDSLSDSGNIEILAGDLFPYDLYPEGQFTNGDSWATQLGLTPSLDGGTNFAYGGARAIENNDVDSTPDLDAQIQQFQTFDPTLGDSPLGVIFIGGNDFRDFANSDLPLGDLDALLAEAGIFVGSLIAQIDSSVQTLSSSEIDDIIIMGLPDLGKLPEYVDTQFGAIVTEVVNQFNGALAVLAMSLNDGLGEDETVGFFDTNSFFLDVVAQIDNSFGFTNVTEICLLAGPACNPDEYVFWDDIHPTDRVHELLAAEFRASIAPIPLPGGMSLALGGIALLGFAARRRKVA